MRKRESKKAGVSTSYDDPLYLYKLRPHHLILLASFFLPYLSLLLSLTFIIFLAHTISVTLSLSLFLSLTRSLS